MMDFTLPETSQAVAGLAAEILSAPDPWKDWPNAGLLDASSLSLLGSHHPAPVLTLGGLVVTPESGQVLRPDGRPVEGLYAAGRTAAGLCSRSYVSGLSLADCIFSGRRAGRSAGHRVRDLHPG